MPLLVLQVVEQARVLKPWFGTVVSSSRSLVDVFQAFTAGSLDGSPPAAARKTSCCCDRARPQGADDAGVAVSPVCLVSDITSQAWSVCNFFRLQLQPSANEPEQSTTHGSTTTPSGIRSAFGVLMAANREQTVRSAQQEGGLEE